MFSDYRHSSADKPYLNIPPSLVQQRPTVDLNAINPTLNRHHTAHLRGRHGIVNYENSSRQREQPKFWTLPKRSTFEQTAPKPLTEPRIVHFSTKPLMPPDRYATSQEESIRISPIDPRTTGSFKSSTPSNKENVVDLSARMLSPVTKSTMTNEELYAVIHKSKKKLNIKDNAERAESPALSSISLSPVSSETSLYSKGTQRYPETGYLGDPRSRMSWSPADKQNMPMYTTGPAFASPKQETCADRHGPVPQTSRLDFKKLLLQHSVKLNTLSPQIKSNKLSAVEQLKLSKDKNQPQTSVGNRSQVNILDLSGSPKTYTQRKVIKPNPQPASPGRTGALIKEHKNTPKILLSPKSQWRFSSPRSDVLSTPIPEANNEDESNSSGEKHDTSPNPPSKTVPIVTNQHFGARRNLIPINENNIEADIDFHHDDRFEKGIFPLNTDFAKSQGLSRSELMQAKRAEFFSSQPDASPPKLTSFKNTSPAGPSGSRSKTSPERSNASPERRNTSPSTLETAL